MLHKEWSSQVGGTTYSKQKLTHGSMQDAEPRREWMYTMCVEPLVTNPGVIAVWNERGMGVVYMSNLMTNYAIKLEGTE